MVGGCISFVREFIGMDPNSGSVVPNSATKEERHHVGDSSSLPEGSRLHVTISGRYVTVLRLHGQLHAIDSSCFHAGGPLGLGDIEDVNGKACLSCPWHFYKIDIVTGDKYYQAAKWEDGRMKAGDWQSNGVKQRVHVVTEEDGQIYIALTKQGYVESDGYAFSIPCGERMKRDSKTTRTVQGVGSDGKMPSGHVLQQSNAARNRSSASPSGLGRDT